MIGAGEASPDQYRLAPRARGCAGPGAGAIVITGGLGGVMEAASRGCREAGGTTLAFLPGVDPEVANSWVTYPLATGMGEVRNALVVRAGEAVVAVGGGWGTLSEIASGQEDGPVGGLCSAIPPGPCLFRLFNRRPRPQSGLCDTAAAGRGVDGLPGSAFGGSGSPSRNPPTNGSLYGMEPSRSQGVSRVGEQGRGAAH